MKKVENVSKIFCIKITNNQYRYGFTITYQFDEFRNKIYHSCIKNDEEILRKLEIERNKIIKAKEMKC